MVSSRGLLLDVRPLVESRPFRAWWLGSALSAFGGQFTSFALLYYVWSTTHDAGLVGGVALAQAVPTVLAALVGARSPTAGIAGGSSSTRGPGSSSPRSRLRRP